MQCKRKDYTKDKRFAEKGIGKQLNYLKARYTRAELGEIFGFKASHMRLFLHSSTKKVTDRMALMIKIIADIAFKLEREGSGQDILGYVRLIKTLNNKDANEFNAE